MANVAGGKKIWIRFYRLSYLGAAANIGKSDVFGIHGPRSEQE